MFVLGLSKVEGGLSGLALSPACAGKCRRILIPASNKYNYLASGSDILYFLMRHYEFNQLG